MIADATTDPVWSEREESDSEEEDDHSPTPTVSVGLQNVGKLGKLFSTLENAEDMLIYINRIDNFLSTHATKNLKRSTLDSTCSYREAIKRLRQLALDVPMTGLEKAIWWTEYVIRHKGAKHLRNPVADLPLYQYYLLDVIGFLLLIVFVSIAIENLEKPEELKQEFGLKDQINPKDQKCISI
ncbi:hypothetical protein NQ318_021891 [Aromia moschata]|uniref:Uncharacterized protein n=1 Tax=Aromia moschata TaxID=1265417 RepID=A0AAV8Z7C4_9CUCU|nr:hypothetical protein NQ318_021891 [Aromia moschata]